MSVTLITNMGRIKVELECLKAPKCSENFLALCGSGYYNNTIFHRNIKEFIIQGGDPTGTGNGGKCIYNSNVFDDEIDDSLKHDSRGVLSMANSGPNTNGSQFFFTYTALEHLDEGYTVFGRIIDGMETLKKMEKVEVDENDKPKKDIVLISTKTHANPFAEGLLESYYELQKDQKVKKEKKKKKNIILKDNN